MSLGWQLQRFAPVAQEDRVGLVGDEQIELARAHAGAGTGGGEYLGDDAIAAADDGSHARLVKRQIDGARARLPVAPAIRRARLHVARELGLNAQLHAEQRRALPERDVAHAGAVAGDGCVRPEPQPGLREHPAAGVLDVAEQRAPTARLDSTLVVVATEFGRPPQFDSGGGRGHQSEAFSGLLAGGGLRTGQVVGQTDELARAIVDRPVSVPDFFATIYAALGINPARELDAGGRPVPITDHGRPIAEVFGT